MPTKLEAKEVIQLVENIANHLECTLDQRGFQKMCRILNDKYPTPDIDPVYLRHRKYGPAVKIIHEGESGKIGFNADFLDKLAKSIGHNDYYDYLENFTEQSDDFLNGYIGNWYCYTRRNASICEIFRSPVQISPIKGKIQLQLFGPRNTFSGRIDREKQCLFCSFSSSDGKRFQHIYRIGEMNTPKIIQGIFCGVSSAFDPIGGRVLLVREENIAFNDMTNTLFSNEELTQSKSRTDRRIAEYFTEYGNNNLKINSVSTFNENDLGECP